MMARKPEMIDPRKFSLVVGSDGVERIEKREHYQQEQEQRILASRIHRAGLSDYMLEYDVNEYIGDDHTSNLAKVQKYIAEFEPRYSRVHLYLWSKANGTQKTTVAQYIGRELLRKNLRVEFTLMQALIQRIERVAFEKVDDEMLHRYMNCDFLIIDDAFDREKTMVYRSNFQFPYIDSFLRERLEIRCKATCFTSNVSIPEIGEAFNASISNLITRNIPDPFEFRDSIGLRNRFDPNTLWA